MPKIATAKKTKEQNGEEVMRDTSEMISYYEKLIEKYPISSIEDGLSEDDWDGWQEMTKRIYYQQLLPRAMMLQKIFQL